MTNLKSKPPTTAPLSSDRFEAFLDGLTLCEAYICLHILAGLAPDAVMATVTDVERMRAAAKAAS